MNAWSDPARPARAASSAASSSPIVDVAVVGGGIVGAAAALAAAQAGLSTTWIAGPAAATPTDAAADRDLRVYALAPATQRFLERLRVWPQLDASRLAPVLDMRVFGDRSGRSALHFGAYASAVERLATIVEHRELVRVLETAVAYSPAIRRVDERATSFAWSPAPSPAEGAAPRSAHAAGRGSTDASDAAVDAVAITAGRDVHRARLLIAADGARSAARDALGIETRGAPYAQRAVVGNFACARPHAGTAFQWFTDEGVIALLPLAARDAPADGGAVSLVWSAPDALADRLIAEGPAALAARLSALCAGPLGPLTALGPIVDVPLALQWAKRLVAPRAALVGDAAHVIHPLAGQGLNLGLADVEALIDRVAARPSFRDCGDPVLLRAYERSRAEPVFAMRRMTDGLSRLFASRRPGVASLRELGLQTVDRIGPLKRWLMRQAAAAEADRPRR